MRGGRDHGASNRETRDPPIVIREDGVVVRAIEVGKGSSRGWR